LPAPVVETQLTARRGRTSAKLRLRVFAPTPWQGSFRCTFELRANDRVLWPDPPDAPAIGGADSLQAFVLALRFAAYELLRFELEHGMKIDAWEWSSLLPLIADAPLDPYMGERITEIQTALRAPMEAAMHQPATAKRKPGTARRRSRTASRKPSTRSRKRRAARQSIGPVAHEKATR
jgi:hypothetical protein